MAEVEIRDVREIHRALDSEISPSWRCRREAGLIDISDILSITRKGEDNLLFRLDSGFTIEMSGSPIAQALAALKLANKQAEKITLVEDEALVITDTRLNDRVVTGNIINCHINNYKDEYLVKLDIETGYSVSITLNQKWLDIICGGENEH